MDSLNIHRVKSIKVREIESRTPPFHWRTIVVTNEDDVDFEITLFGKEANLELREDV